jgi:hypothetical protein
MDRVHMPDLVINTVTSVHRSYLLLICSQIDNQYFILVGYILLFINVTTLRNYFFLLLLANNKGGEKKRKKENSCVRW